MFAVTPKPWCEHLASHVKPLPSAGIDATKVCETCGSAQEPWICLTCYHVSCRGGGRSRKGEGKGREGGGSLGAIM